MHAIWVSLKENLSCRSKLTDVIRRSEKIGKDRKFIFKKENSESELVHPVEEQVCQLILRQNHPHHWYYELNTGDPSRNIVEMIIRAASTTYPSKPSRKIKKVLRVNNPVETVERFEKYRETVKKRAQEEQRKQHLRTTVDGNELLQFYGTTMNCSSGKQTRKVSEACKDPTCRVCRVIQSGFNTVHTRKNGIQLSTSSEEVSEDVIGITKGKNLKRAVLVCRTIAGTVANVVDDEKSWEEHDSVRIGGLYSKTEYLIVKNPSAVLPCFVVVFN